MKSMTTLHLVRWTVALGCVGLVMACSSDDDTDAAAGSGTDTTATSSGDGTGDTTGDETTGDATTGDATTGDATTGDDATGDATTGDDTTTDTGGETGDTTGDDTTGDATTGGDTGDDSFELAGDWADNFGQELTISEEKWGFERIDSWSNVDNTAITQNAVDAEFSPGAYNKTVWTEPTEDGTFWGCTVAFGLDSAEAAAADETAWDDSDPANAGCGGFSWTHFMPALEVGGVYATGFGGMEKVTSFMWHFGWAINAVTDYDNDANWALLQAPEDDAFNPSKFSKVVWTETEAGSSTSTAGALWYCTITFGHDTAEAALADETIADPADPATSGCGGFGWTRLIPTLEIAGTWHSSFGGNETISADSWMSPFLTTAMIAWDNDANWAITQNPADAEFAPNTFAKQVWTQPEADGAFWYCTVAFGLASADEAIADPTAADATDPATTGCGGFGWTRLAPTIEIAGTYLVQGEDVPGVINSDTLAANALLAYDNDDNWAIGEMDGAFSTAVWLEPEADGFWLCLLAHSLATVEEAEAVDITLADGTAPDTGGCSGGPWLRFAAVAAE
ncbi:MAG: hypothetical protein ACI9WU_000039 [Myxococcota bacterium]|jgi:hypothetical protein